MSRVLRYYLIFAFRPVLMDLDSKPLLSIRAKEVDAETGLPTIVHNVSVYEDMSFKIHHQGVLLSTDTMLDIVPSTKLSTTSLETTMLILRIWRALMRKGVSKRLLFECFSPREAFVDVVRAVTARSSIARYTSCPKWSRALFNLFAGDMVRDINSAIHAKRGNCAAKKSTDDKRRKLSGIKKS